MGGIIGLVAVLVFTLAACQTVANPRLDRVVLISPYLSSGVSDAVARHAASLAAKLLHASRAESASNYPSTALLDAQERTRLVANGASAVALLDVLVLPGEPGYRVNLRLLDDQGVVFAVLRLHLATLDGKGWSEALTSPVPGLVSSRTAALVAAWWTSSPVSDVRALAWQDALERAHAAGDFTEALRLTDLLASLPLTVPQSKALAGLVRELRDGALVLVPGGTYRRGSTDGNSDEKPVHQVTVPPFAMARYEVTQDLYQAVTGTNPSLFQQLSQAGARPVERVSWLQAVEFCNKLSARDGFSPVYTVGKSRVTQDLTRSGYRLPTEAEWEWAARGGQNSRELLFAGGNNPGVFAWTDRKDGPQPVGGLAPNRLGIYDLSGNVWEWCWDWYGKYDAAPQTAPVGPDTGVLKVGRGGSWRAAAWNARVTSRSFDNPAARANILGFRVVRSAPVIPQEAK